MEELKRKVGEKQVECERILGQWVECEKLWKAFEVGLVAAEDKFAGIDPYLKSQSQLEETKGIIGNILEEAKALESTHLSLCTYAGYILKHLKGNQGTEVQQNSLQAKLDQLTLHYKTYVE